MLFPHYPSLGCEHPADGRMRGLSSSFAQVVQRKTEVQTPHPTCGNENFCLPGTHHRVALEISPEGPASFGVFHNKGLASWIQTKLSVEASLAEILPTVCPFGKSSFLPKSFSFPDPAVLRATQNGLPEGEGSCAPAAGCTGTRQAAARALQ